VCVTLNVQTLHSSLLRRGSVDSMARGNTWSHNYLKQMTNQLTANTTFSTSDDVCPIFLDLLTVTADEQWRNHQIFLHQQTASHNHTDILLLQGVDTCPIKKLRKIPPLPGPNLGTTLIWEKCHMATQIPTILTISWKDLCRLFRKNCWFS